MPSNFAGAANANKRTLFVSHLTFRGDTLNDIIFGRWKLALFVAVFSEFGLDNLHGVKWQEVDAFFDAIDDSI